jgi:hypothetical protein
VTFATTELFLERLGLSELSTARYRAAAAGRRRDRRSERFAGLRAAFHEAESERGAEPTPAFDLDED